MPCWHFMACFILKIGPKMGKIAYFHKNANISKSRQRYLLLTEKCQKPEIWPSCTQKQDKKKFLATFSIFDFFAEIWGVAGQKPQKIVNFGLQRPRFWQKSQKSKSCQKFFFVLFLCTTWPNFRFLAPFYGEFYTLA